MPCHDAMINMKTYFNLNMSITWQFSNAFLNLCISNGISLKFVSMVGITNKSASLQQWLGTEWVSSHYLNERWRPCPLTHTCVARHQHHNDVIMGTIASQITSLTIVYSVVYSDADQRKHQSSASLAFVWGIHRGPVNSRTNGQLRGKCFHLMTSSICCTHICLSLGKL